ncbi:hypothetical protein, partial [Pseudomonas sp. 2822-17]|uniref:hypothetical protein n=1 Tax=Pseudomonas sp. 2822-17 TaxID=1712678 RepID=UPI000C597830
VVDQVEAGEKESVEIDIEEEFEEEVTEEATEDVEVEWLSIALEDIEAENTLTENEMVEIAKDAIEKYDAHNLATDEEELLELLKKGHFNPDFIFGQVINSVEFG